MNPEELHRYLDRDVVVAVPHFFIPDKLFFYHGRVLNVDDDSITIKTKKGGLSTIKISQIQQIVEEGGML